jgi:hypothetical protein
VKPVRVVLVLLILAPVVLFAEVAEAHVNLVLHVTPDVVSGLRVWAGAPSAEFDGRTTSVPGVTRSRHDDDQPTSASNRP